MARRVASDRARPREAAATAALREVEEEAGITGVVLGPVRTVIRQGFTTLTSIDYFLIEYTGRSNDGDAGGCARRLDQCRREPARPAAAPGQ